MTQATPLTRQQRIVREVKRTGLVLLVAVTVLGWALYNAERAKVDDLVTTNLRQRPTADYIAAEFTHLDCRKNREDQFLAAVGAVFDTSLTADQRRAAQDAAHLVRVVLGNIEGECPTPIPPTYDDHGNLVTGTITPSTTTTASSTTTTSPP